MKRVGAPRIGTMLFFGTLGVLGLLFLLVLHDVRMSQNAMVAEENHVQQGLEMPVTLMPLYAAETERDAKTEVLVKEPIHEEKIPTEPDKPAAQAPAKDKEAAEEPGPRETDLAVAKESAGRFPALVASYNETGGLSAHLMRLRALGARTFVADMDQQRLVAEVDPSNWSLSRDFAPLRGMALDRSRLIDDDYNVRAVLARAQSVYGYGNFVFVLLMPRAVENRILSSLSRAFQRIGRPARDFVSVHGSYYAKGRGLCLKVSDARDIHGNTVPLSTEILLGP